MAEHTARAGYTRKSWEADLHKKTGYTVKLTPQIKPKKAGYTVKLTHYMVYPKPWIKLLTYHTTIEVVPKTHKHNTPHQ